MNATAEFKCPVCGEPITSANTDSIEITMGPDWADPPRWQPDAFRRFMPGMKTYEPCGHSQ